MTPNEEVAMHDLAVSLETLTRGTGWEAMRYEAIGRVMAMLTEYCAVPCKRCAERDSESNAK